jgi:formylglycine-generating enzyme required for sulfatase activity
MAARFESVASLPQIGAMTSSAAMKKFFLSYRRADAATAAHLLCEKLEERFGAGEVFFDVDSIPLGTDFHGYLTDQIRACRVLIVVIGRQWLEIADGDGQPRLHNPADFVRIEIETALSLNIPVVPVLVDHAVIPAADKLPPSIRVLAKRQSAEIRPGTMFREQLAKLLDGLQRLLDSPPPSPPEAPVSSALKDASREGEAPAEPKERTAPPRPSGSAGASPSRVHPPGIPDDLADPSAWVTVPAGRYYFGEPKQPFEIPAAFQLSKYLVTNGQFARFVAAGGYDNDSLWDKPGWTWRRKNGIDKPGYWQDSKWNGATQPVVGVSWYEAEAFCRWAECRLPTEREWEAAARGPDGWNYPWGDDWKEGVCNTSEAGLGVTTPVGKFPQSAAVCGAQDMAGNVWEWCQDWYDRSEKSRVVRGGSWVYVSRSARSAIRDWGSPDDRFNNLGFRVVSGVRTS